MKPKCILDLIIDRYFYEWQTDRNSYGGIMVEAALKCKFRLDSYLGIMDAIKLADFADRLRILETINENEFNNFIFYLHNESGFYIESLKGA